MQATIDNAKVDGRKAALLRVQKAVGGENVFSAEENALMATGK